MMELQTVLSPSRRPALPPIAASFVGDERLARMIARGNEAACRVLYERYHQPLYRYCRSLLHNEADAQDALQTTFLSALGALSRGQRDAPMRPWLFRIAHNESVSLLRRRRRDQEISELSEQSTNALEEQVVERERLALLVSDLRELPERQRAALVMKELSGLSHEEIALALDASVGATKQSIFEARRSLMEFAEGRAMACEEVCQRISDADGRVLRSRRIRAHLRHCQGCAAFAAEIPERGRQLRALAPPLPALTAAGIFARALGGGSAPAGNTAGLAAAGTGKAVGATVALKATTVAVAVTAAVGATVALRLPAPKAHPHHRAAMSGADHTVGSGGAGAGPTSTRPSVRLPAPASRRLGGAAPRRAGVGAHTRAAKTMSASRGNSVVPSSRGHGSARQNTSGRGRPASHALKPSHGPRQLSPARGLGPPAYPAQRSQGSVNRSGSARGSGAGTPALGSPRRSGRAPRAQARIRRRDRT